MPHLPILLLHLLLFIPFTTSLSDDETCLTNIYNSLHDPHRNLRNWSLSSFSSPCDDSTSHLAGVTCNNNRMFKLFLSNLSLSGTITPLLSPCSHLQSLDVSSNSLSGPIPPSMSSLVNLAFLNLSHNSLSGNIPNDLSLCAYLNVIDLSSNSLTGMIPSSIAGLARLRVFVVSDNELEGMIPEGVGRRFNASGFAGNERLFGFPLAPARGKELTVWGIVWIGLGSGMLSLVVSFTAVCIWLKVTERSAAVGEGGAGDGKDGQLMPEY